MSRVFKWLRTLAALTGFWWLVVTFTPLVGWWARLLAQPWGSGQGDVLVVLGGDSLSDTVLGSSSYWRSVYTVRAMRDHPFRQVIISGTPALLMRDFVRGHGIDTANVVVETNSKSTEENARAVAPLLRAGDKVVLLTSDYHAWRAFRVFRKAGLQVDPWPVPDILKRNGTWHSRAGLFVELAIETSKIAWYRWKGWI